MYGVGVAKTTADAAELNGIEVVGTDSIDPKAPNYRSLASKIADSGADAVFFGGIIDNNAVQLYKDLGAAMPDATFWGPDGVAESRRSRTTSRRTSPTGRTSRSRRSTAEGLRAEWPEVLRGLPAPSTTQKVVQPYAIYGYEAMDVILDSMERAGDSCNDRQAVIDEFFNTKDKEGVTGTYDIDEDGDVNLSQFGRYRIENGELTEGVTVQVEQDSNGNPLG